MALKEHSSLKLGIRPSFSFISSNSSAVNLNCSAVFTVISINVDERLLRKRKGNYWMSFILTRKSKYFNYLPTPKYAALNYLLFAVYFIVLSWLILRVPFIKNAGINHKILLGLFFIKILAGIAIGWIAIHIYGSGNDYWDVNDYAREEYHLLFTNPAKYFANIFTSDYQGGYGGIFSSGDSYWNDLKGNIVIKLVSIFNVLSRGDYYINSLFFNFIIFFGHVILYRLFIKIFPERNLWIIIGCFLLPSTIYFSSGIHKDGLVFLMIAVLIYSVYESILKNSISIKRILLILVSLVFLFLLRNFIFLALVPALFAWILVAKTKWPAIPVFAAVYLLCGLLVFNIDAVAPKIKPLEIIIAKQTEYLKLEKAATQIELTPLQPTFKSFAFNAPQAINHSFLRPYLLELPVKSLLPLSIELFLYQFLFVLFLFFKRKNINPSNTTFLFFTIFFVFTVFLIIGYIVPNLGSLVRYRSLYLPLLITPILCCIDWQKLVGKFKL